MGVRRPGWLWQLLLWSPATCCYLMKPAIIWTPPPFTPSPLPFRYPCHSLVHTHTHNLLLTCKSKTRPFLECPHHSPPGKPVFLHSSALPLHLHPYQVHFHRSKRSGIARMLTAALLVSLCREPKHSGLALMLLPPAAAA